jgi:hypothetical protein
MSVLKAGDRVKIKNRSDWYLPSAYPPVNATGTVFEVVEDPKGYVKILLDEDVTGIDKKVPLAFRLEAIEKISTKRRGNA